MPKSNIALEVLRIDEPCPADWGAMSGDDAARFCQGCQKTVHNLSAMTRDDAERLLCESAGQLCARFERDAAGTVITLGYQPPKPRRCRWAIWAAVAAFGAVASAANYVLLRPKVTAVLPSPTPALAPTNAAWTMGVVCVMPSSRPSPVNQPVAGPWETLLSGEPVSAPEQDPRPPVVPADLTEGTYGTDGRGGPL